MCECFQVGGPFISEDPDCPIHGADRVEQDNGLTVDLHRKATDLLNHLEDVLDSENFDKIDHKLWNAVSMFLVNNKIEVPR